MTTKAKSKSDDKLQPDLDPVDEAKAAGSQPVEPLCAACHTPIREDQETGKAFNDITGKTLIAHKHCADTQR